MDKKIVFLLLCGTLMQATSVDQCIDRIIDFSLLDYRARRIGIDRIGTPLNDEIRILSDIQFTCSTTINSVILGIDVRPNRDSFPSVQIWRPSVGSNYDFVPGSERFIFYTTENVSRTGVYDYPLEPPLEVEPGDLLAFSQPSESDSGVRGYYIDQVSFNTHSIDFGEETTDLSGTPINNNLVLVYPILTDKQCVNSISSVNATFIKDQSLLISESRRREQRQLLYPELKFSCNGSVTKWIYGAVDRLDHPEDTELPEIQIWRQTDTDNYTKETFSNVSANETEPGTNIHEYYPETPLEFQEGDILGYFQPREDDSQIVIYAQREGGPTNLRVDSNVDIAPIAVSISELQEEGENDYPLISLEISVSPEQIVTPTVIITESDTLMSSTMSSTIIIVNPTSKKLDESDTLMSSVMSTTIIIVNPTSKKLDDGKELIGVGTGLPLLFIIIFNSVLIIIILLVKYRRTKQMKDKNMNPDDYRVYYVPDKQVIEVTNTENGDYDEVSGKHVITDNPVYEALSGEHLITDDNPSYNIHTLLGEHVITDDIHTVSDERITTDDNPAYKIHTVSDEQITTDDNPAYNIHTVSDERITTDDNPAYKIHTVSDERITTDDNPAYNIHTVSDERITTDDNPAYNIHTVSDERITTDDNPAYNIHTVSDERITTDDNQAYNIHTVSDERITTDDHPAYNIHTVSGEYSTYDYI